MATLTVFDPITSRTKTINVTLETAIIEGDQDATTDYFIKFVTSAKKISGASINPKIIRTLNDGVKAGGTQQHDGSAVPYSSMNAAINDYILNMVEGNGGSDAMNFVS